jgi:hypothetical protein
MKTKGTYSITCGSTENRTRDFYAHNLRTRMPSRPSSLNTITAKKLVTYLSTHNLNTKHEHNKKYATHLKGINTAGDDTYLMTAKCVTSSGNQHGKICHTSENQHC